MAAIFHQLIYKIISVLISLSMLFGGTGEFFKVDTSDMNTNYKFVFVHGLMGWGSYDDAYQIMPYWGMFGGDLMEYLNDKGFDCYAASVGGNSSAWDRACDLYAQLTGTVVDYGKEHSERCAHERFGADYTGRALIDSFSETDKINLLGHSFGGATVRLFASIMENGSETERNYTDESDLSDFFKGGKGDYIYSITTLAAPHNGTTAYSVDSDDLDQYVDTSRLSSAAKTKLETLLANLIKTATGLKNDTKIESDYADYDMYIDNALALNETISTLENAYYFSYACCSSVQDQDGNYIPVENKTESMFKTSAKAMGAYTGVTKAGYVIDETWQMNDGLVNTKSALAPFNAPQTEYDKDNVQKGVWNIMPIYDGDHMSLQGGMTIPNDIKGFYVDLLKMINEL